MIHIIKGLFFWPTEVLSVSAPPGDVKPPANPRKMAGAVFTTLDKPKLPAGRD
jgi:hypothetical protein